MNEPRLQYVQKMSVLCQPLEIVDERRIADACEHQWFNQTLCQVNESVVRLGVRVEEKVRSVERSFT